MNQLSRHTPLQQNRSPTLATPTKEVAMVGVGQDVSTSRCVPGH